MRAISKNSACSFDEEQALWHTGIEIIAGIDEAGRGPLAGPVVAAAVVLPRNFPPSILNDSKKLSLKRRETLFEVLTSHPGVEIGTGFASVAEIDQLNILRATHLAMRRAVDALPCTPQHALIDGLPVRPFPIPQTALVGGDARSMSIAAASIIAKQTRDAEMRELEQVWPGYGFAAHKGYGTREHLAALERLGPCPQHRRSFQPVAQRVFSFLS